MYVKRLMRKITQQELDMVEELIAVKGCKPKYAAEVVFQSPEYYMRRLYKHNNINLPSSNFGSGISTKALMPRVTGNYKKTFKYNPVLFNIFFDGLKGKKNKIFRPFKEKEKSWYMHPSDIQHMC